MAKPMGPLLELAGRWRPIFAEPAGLADLLDSRQTLKYT